MLIMLGTAALAEKVGTRRAGITALALAAAAYLAIILTMVNALLRGPNFLFG